MQTIIIRGKDILVGLSTRKVSSDDQIIVVKLRIDEEGGRNIGDVAN
jgi:hypothetical protein